MTEAEIIAKCCETIGWVAFAAVKKAITDAKRPILDDFQAEVSGWCDGVYAGTREDWIDRALAAEAEVERLRNNAADAC